MQIDISCPSCGATFKVDEQHIGKTGKCAKCGSRVRIERNQPSYALPPVAPLVSAPPVPDDWPADWPKAEQSPAPVATRAPAPFATKSPPPLRAVEPAEADSVKQPFATDRLVPRLIVLGGCLASLTVGYFAGREHLKYELRSIVEDGSKQFAQSFAKGWQDGVKKAFPAAADTGNKPVKPPNATSQASESSTKEPEKPEPPKLTEFGEAFFSTGFQLAVVNAQVGQPEVRDMFGKKRRGVDSELMVTFQVKNTDERKILRHRPKNPFLGSHFKLQDDVENEIRGIDYGTGTKLVGELTGSEDILPGSEATHIEVFSVPPPKTKYLVLTVDLALLGGEGEATFKIPVERIANFPK